MVPLGALCDKSSTRGWVILSKNHQNLFCENFDDCKDKQRFIHFKDCQYYYHSRRIPHPIEICRCQCSNKNSPIFPNPIHMEEHTLFLLRAYHLHKMFQCTYLKKPKENMFICFCPINTSKLTFNCFAFNII